MQKSKSFSDFGTSFQEKLAELILRDRAFSEQIEEILEIQYFEKRYLRKFVELVFEYKKEYDVHPSLDIMESIINNDLEDIPDALQTKVHGYFTRVKARGEDVEVEDADYVKESALDFCKKQDLHGAILQSLDLIESGSYDEIEGVIKNSLQKGQDNDVGHEYIKDFETRYEGRSRDTISTGWPNIDEITQGGQGKGELGVCIGATGSGKSMVLCHFGAEALKEGRNVVHYTLELQSEVVGNRYDSCLTNVPLNDLDDHKDEILEGIEDVPGKLVIKEYPTKQATTQTLKRHLEKVMRREEDGVDMVIVDYADLLRPISEGNALRHDLQSIYEELRAIAKEYEVAMYTASQSNRDGVNKEVITMEEISEAFNKCFVSDFIFSIARTQEDKETNGGRLFIAKNRNGPDGIVFPIFMETATVSIDVLDNDGKSAREIQEERKERMQEDITDTYQKFKQEKFN